MTYRLDHVDRRILYHLLRDARNTTAPTIADEVNVSAATVRNRIQQLEEQGIITGYHANVDFEQVGGRLTNLFVCTAEVPDREKVAQQVLSIPGVIDVRALMAGKGNLHVTAVGEDMDDLSRIARALSNLGLDIEEENLLQRRFVSPYEPFGPEDTRRSRTMTDFMSLAGGAELVEFTVSEDAPIAGRTIEEASEAGLIGEDILIVAIERDDTVITPKGDTRIRPDDIVTVFARRGSTEDVLQVLTQPEVTDT